ncbi:DegT/DnrJ/EryC1/StrS family aminotransferase [Aliifodinibius sp. S!AR15-10]|uniref:DegT/DnrJ/EryC1/StrS family aminotransferase n=1 Tax=Aliifodinibius sp. S!AR15-10 TaxID=2950437 RepID=UPI00285EDB30|nr:DegT/DnrJ/EryC1/StrS family aminotransferase [Aliifodinibius sp. S!AR15-10]MDR8392141.1 DegT/DnrJ/EryC1/StrS family aminotransferase [Aliifodinibius sp. S!AR15-10]
MPSRKEVLKILSTFPLGVAAANSAFGSGHAGPILSDNAKTTAVMGPEIFRSIGVEPVINCRGTFTIIGGSIERPAVREAMDAASQSYIQYDELAEGIGRRLAELTGAEWGIVTAGCAAAMKHATAACVTGGNPEKLIRIPDLTGFEKTEVIIPRESRNAYDHAVRNIGVKVINVETPEELEAALNPRTAMIYMASWQPEPLGTKTVARIAKQWQVPILMDAAAEDLTIPNVHLQDGATMVCYSGGKALRGPQCAGMLLGPRDLLMSAWQASSPHHGPGRDNKVGREEMMGMLAAVEAWVKVDHETEWEMWLSWLEHISDRVSDIKGVETEIEEPDRLSNHSPVLHIYWKVDNLHIAGDELAETLGRTKPRIVVGSGDGPDPGTTSINITAWMMKPGEDEIVADRIYNLLTQKRRPKENKKEEPSSPVTGRWIVNVEFFSSESQHTFYIEKQDGNWIEGSHKGDFSVRDIAGTVEGDQVKLLSTDRHPADRITNIFTGTLSRDGNSISGEVYLGEYLTARFKATRHSYPEDREPVRVPGGPPLAT